MIFVFVYVVNHSFSQGGYIPVADCEPPKSSAYLDINNVRAKILGGSDMWWDLQGAPEYEVPKGSGKHPFFTGALWVGGKDANDQLHVMGHRFRQSGVTAYPGPLVTGNSDAGTTSAEVCHDYDQLYKINREQVETFRKWYDCKKNPDCNTEAHFPGYAIPDEILNWPAHGPAGGYAYYLAPFWDANNDGVYNPYDGDFPYFEFPHDGITDNPDCIDIPGLEPKLYGDQTIWQVFNDSGNDDGTLGGEPLGFEFHAQAYAYATNDVLNDQTFYHYRMINRSTNAYHDVYIGLWTDADLGNPRDDYVGCDVSRGLGYHYNGDDVDENDGSSLGYGDNPPAAGIDFVAGPYKNKNHKDDASNWIITEDGNRQIDCDAADFMNGNINGQNFEDGIVDNERLGMQHFMYFNGTGGGNNPGTTGPEDATDHYEYLTGHWKDGSHLKYGGTGHQSDTSATNVNTMFMFPGDPTTDPCGWGQNGQVMPGWSEETEGNEPYDRRYVISTGPISMEPGAVNDFTIAALYGRAFKGSAWESVKALKRVDDAVQAMFNRCFRVLDGPDDPELNIVELDGKLVLQIMNDITSNNYLESYKERDPKIPGDAVDNNDEKYYHFQGYQVFQLKDEHVDFWENRYDTTKVKAIFQCDIKDDVENLVNYKLNPESDALDEQLEVNAANEGIVHSFELTTDAFPWGDEDKLVNHKTLYFVAKAYASNQWNVFSSNDPGSFSGQTEPYLTGREKPVIYKATAHKNLPENQGTVLFSDYGDGVEITQMEGYGNGNNVIDLTEASIETIMRGSPWKDTTPTYQQGRGPVDVKVIDPLNVVNDTYTLEFINANVNYYGLVEETDWILVNADNDTIDSDHAITKNKNEQLLPELGLSISIAQVDPAAYKNRNPNRNGFLEASIAFEDPDKPWLAFVPDGDKFDAFNWIRVGTYYDGNFMSPNPNYDDYLGMDPDEYYEDILGGTWAPVYLTSTFKYGPCYNRSQMDIDKYGPLSSVDIVITSDKSKWTRCVVLEMCENEWTTNEYGYEVEVTPRVNYLSEGNALRFDLRQSPSVDKDGNPDNSSTHGMGWFPGYAIDVRTGERLNMAFGEDSWLAGDNGNDMMWNPSSSVYDSLNGPRFGGKHYIYVFGHTNNVQTPEISSPAYDSCKWIYNKMRQYEETRSVMYKRRALSGAMWTAIPYLNDDCDLLETDVKIRIRLATPYFYRDFPPEDTVRDKPCKYVFNTTNIQTMTQNSEVAESALDLIRVVPNPYYGYSYYESSGTRCVKITNLPQTCTISIFDVSGTLVRRFTKSDDMPWLEWDLNDQSGKRIGGGMYIIHIDAPEIGEKVVKWFGAMSE
ncbi:MAG: hypothetical protein ACQES1_03240 [Bacteroidota bacterium]